MLTWASEKVAQVRADQPHLRNDLQALVERLNGEARAPSLAINAICYVSIKSANCCDVAGSLVKVDHDPT